MERRCGNVDVEHARIGGGGGGVVEAGPVIEYQVVMERRMNTKCNEVWYQRIDRCRTPWGTVVLRKAECINRTDVVSGMEWNAM